MESEVYKELKATLAIAAATHAGSEYAGPVHREVSRLLALACEQAAQLEAFRRETAAWAEKVNHRLDTAQTRAGELADIFPSALATIFSPPAD